MTNVSRRSFLAGGVCAAALSGRQAFSDPPPAQQVRSGADLVTLGRTGIRTSLLGLGTNEHVLRKTEDFDRVVRHALDRGLRFIDTATPTAAIRSSARRCGASTAVVCSSRPKRAPGTPSRSGPTSTTAAGNWGQRRSIAC